MSAYVGGCVYPLGLKGCEVCYAHGDVGQISDPLYLGQKQDLGLPGSLACLGPWLHSESPGHRGPLVSMHRVQRVRAISVDLCAGRGATMLPWA